jgi:ubiquinone biosynthesis protein Coq4|tara:strand:+ start:482 stop:712 length:231 start_codon:yes stop_codon:yes gene_type:complete
MATMNARLDTNNPQTFYKAIDSYIEAVAKEGNQDVLSGLYDMFMDNDYASDIQDMMESKNTDKPLLKEFKRIGGTK